MVKSVLPELGGERVKTDVRLPRELVDTINGYAAKLGTPRNVIYTLALTQYCADLAKQAPDKVTGMKLLTAMSQLFTDVVQAARKSL